MQPRGDGGATRPLNNADWFDDLAVGRTVEPAIGFMEPNLEFEARGRADAGVVVRAWIEGELRPSWAPFEAWDERDLFADFDLSAEPLRAAARALRGQALRFPPRLETD
jgi:hypothetical protein